MSYSCVKLAINTSDETRDDFEFQFCRWEDGKVSFYCANIDYQIFLNDEDIRICAGQLKLMHDFLIHESIHRMLK